jgi:Replication initiator protein A
MLITQQQRPNDVVASVSNDKGRGMMPGTNPLVHAAGPSGESPSPLRLGKDEMNLAEFPITLLTDRVPKGQKVLQYRDEIFDEKTSRIIARKLTISASESDGLPTALDDDVILGLIQLTKVANNFTSRRVAFGRSELIRMLDWPDSGFSYRRIATSLKRWLGVSLVYENAWWDKRQQAWTTKGFHIIDNFELSDSRAGSGRADLFPSHILWNEVVFESFEAGYLKTIDYDFYRRLEHPTAKRMYRFLSKRMYRGPDLSFDLCDFAIAHSGLSPNYRGNAGKLKEKLRPALEELEAAGFLEPLGKADRYRKIGKDWEIRLVRRATPPVVAKPDQPDTEPPPLAAALAHRGVTGTTAAALVGQHPAERIEAKLEVFDWLAEKQDKRVARSPAGYLVKSITDDYAAPKGFEPKAAREEKQADELERKRQAEEAKRRTEADERTREEADQLRVGAYLESLTPEEREALQAEALAKATPFFARQYRRSKGNAKGEARYLKLIVAMHVSGILAGQE